jgi:hypothetical protein
MLTRDELLWLVDESALDEPADLLTIPAIKQHDVHDDLHDEDIGLRSLLERPEALLPSWRRAERARTRRARSKSGKRRRELRAA